MLNTKEQNQLERLLEKQKAPIEPLNESDLKEIEETIVAVYDKSPSLFGDGMSAWKNFCTNLEVIASQNDRLVIEVRRLKSELEKIDKPNEPTL